MQPLSYHLRRPMSRLAPNSSDGNKSRSRNLLGGRRRRLLISNLGRTTEASLRFGLDTKGGRLGQSIHHIATMD